MAIKKSFTLKSSQVHLFSYLTGLLTAILIFSLFSLFIGYKIGFSNFFPQPAIVLPQDILNELTQLKAPMDNANNPTKVNKHDTFLVRPDKELGYVLKPDIRISVSMLKSAQAINVDPPVLHLNTNVQYSDRLKTYLKKESRVDYTYSTDGKGFRKTVPNVKSDKQILIIGDSVAFGVGVDDENTAASHLQKLIGEQYQIINAGVGAYTGQQVFLMAKRLSDEKKFAGLIYIACQNDFMDGKDWVVEAKDILTKISTLSNRFDNRVIVLLETYMEYNLRDFFLEKGWSGENIEKTHSLRQSLPKITADLRFEYHDWTEDVRKFMENEKSIFSRFALYTDHAHLSPLGNRIMANTLFSIIQRKWSETDRVNFPG